jgi:hypothetical protein
MPYFIIKDVTFTYIAKAFGPLAAVIGLWFAGEWIVRGFRR